MNRKFGIGQSNPSEKVISQQQQRIAVTAVLDFVNSVNHVPHGSRNSEGIGEYILHACEELSQIRTLDVMRTRAEEIKDIITNNDTKIVDKEFKLVPQFTAEQKAFFEKAVDTYTRAVVDSHALIALLGGSDSEKTVSR